MAQTIAGALVGGALGAYGKKPDEIKLETINPADSANQALDINLSTLPKAEALASDVNLFNQSQLDKLIEMALPGGPSQIKKNIMAELRGELPPDVVEEIQRSVASRASVGGFSGTGFSSALGARDLGLSSLALTERGLNSAARWLAQSTAPVMDVSRSFFSPQQLLAFNVGERDRRYEAERVNAGIRAAPDPNAAQLAQGFDNFFKTWSSIGTMAAGNAMGGGGSSVGSQSSFDTSMGFNDSFSGGRGMF